MISIRTLRPLLLTQLLTAICQIESESALSATTTFSFVLLSVCVQRRSVCR